MARRKKKPGMYRWDPAAYWEGMTPVDWEEYQIQMESLRPRERWATLTVQEKVPPRILGVDIAEHVKDVMSVSCLTYDSTTVGHEGRSASLLTFFRRNLQDYSIGDLIESKGFGPCPKCDGKNPAKTECQTCGSRGWVDNGSVGVESIDDFGSEANVHNSSASTEPKTWLDVSSCEVDSEWLESQSPAVQEILGWFTNLPENRRTNIAEEFKVIPPSGVPRSDKERTAKKRDLRKWKELQEKHELNNVPPPTANPEVTDSSEDKPSEGEDQSETQD